MTTRKGLRNSHGWCSEPSLLSIRRIVTKFEKELTLHEKKPIIRHRKVRSNEGIRSVMEYASLSIPRRSQELELSTTITLRILGSDLG